MAQVAKKKTTPAQARRLIAEHLTRAVDEGSTCVHMCGLAGEGDDEETTFEELIRIAFANRRRT